MPTAVGLPNEYQNEHDQRLKAEDDNVKLESMLKERDNDLNQLIEINEALKSDKNTLNNGKNKLLNDVERYKNHIMILTEQTEKLTNELKRIIEEDTELYNLNNNQIQRLQKVIYENKKLLHDEIEALNLLENYVNSQPGLNEEHSSPIRTKISQSRQTYIRQEKN